MLEHSDMLWLSSKRSSKRSNQGTPCGATGPNQWPEPQPLCPLLPFYAVAAHFGDWFGAFQVAYYFAGIKCVTEMKRTLST